MFPSIAGLVLNSKRIYGRILSLPKKLVYEAFATTCLRQLTYNWPHYHFYDLKRKQGDYLQTVHSFIQQIFAVSLCVTMKISPNSIFTIKMVCHFHVNVNIHILSYASHIKTLSRLGFGICDLDSHRKTIGIF